MYAKRVPSEEPLCVTCRIDPVDENRDALKIFSFVRDQVLMGSAGPVSINQLAIHKAMDLYEIENRVACFEKTVRLGRWWTRLYPFYTIDIFLYQIVK